jgi:hypothetical protein
MKRPSIGSQQQQQPSSSNNNTKDIPPISGNVLFNSYQKGGNNASSSSTTTAYQPPIFYAKDQTSILEDTTKTYYQVDETANKVLNQLTQQRQQIQHASEDIYSMQNTAHLAQREIELLRTKYRKKKQQLYMWITILSITDLLLFLRMIQCHGNFYCW